MIQSAMLLVLGAGSLPVQAPAAGNQRVVVTPAGAFYRTDAPAAPSGGPAPMQTAGTIWTRTDMGNLWIGNAVSIGNHGSEVFAEYDLNNEMAELFSAFDSNPPNPLWSDTSVTGADDHHVASAESSNVHVGLRTFNQGQPNSTCVLSKYTTLSGGLPDWTYTFPIAANGSNLGISRDGQTIVAAASDPASSSVAIAVFTPASSVPVSYTTFALGGTNNGIRGFDLSADGSTLYFSAAGNPVNAYIFDIASAQVVFSTLIGASFDSHGISGDGSVFAYGSFGVLRIWQKVLGVYQNTITHFMPGPCYCGYLDVSDDGSTVACGFTYYNTYQQIMVEAWDVPGATITMTDLFSSTTPGLQNIVSGVSMSADGQRFGVGLWGDGPGGVAEARLYSKTQNAPIATIGLNGSVFGLEISADGQRAVFGSKAVHANLFGNGGQLDLLGDDTPFENFCFGSGTLVTPCPCGNYGLPGRGCENSASTGGALLTAGGTTSPDTVVLTSSNMLPHPLSIFLQGNTDNLSGIVFGDGLRCVSGTLKRLYTRTAAAGTASAPIAGEPSITARSAALGDPIGAGQTRSYQVYYRDPQLGFCPAPGDAWNVSSAVRVAW